MSVASTSLESLRQKAKQGCITCGIFVSAIEAIISKTRDVPGTVDDSRVTFEFQMSYLGDSLGVFVVALDLHISFFAAEYTPWLQATLPDLPLGQTVPKSTCTEASIEWVRQQLRQCTSSHPSCQPLNSESRKMPSRILNLGISERDPVYLMDSPGEAEPYACLSYCWGDRPFLATNGDNIVSLRRQIPWKSLPTAFQEAVLFLRRLNIRYLWIDSLCIIQDNLDDWKQESSQMASIYQNAHLVISATKSSSPHEGLFSVLDEKFQAHVLSVPVPDGQTEHVLFRPSLTHMPGPTGYGSRQKPALPTLSRGWILQERLLATRVLHFGPQELLWECQQQSACQCTVNQAPTPTDTAAPLLSSITWGRRALQLKSSFNVRSWSSWSDRELGRCWHKLVEEYSRLQLTHETDIFPAFSGVAKLFGEASRSKSLAGLWEKTLPSDLLWHVADSVDADAAPPGSWGRPCSWRAPTWSWASVNRPVAFIDTSDGLDACCEVREAVCEVAGLDSTGEIAGGFLALQGNLISQRMSYPSPGPEELTPWRLYELDIRSNRVRNIWADVNTSVEGKNHLPGGSEVYCLPVGVRRISKAIECLLLKRVVVKEEASCETYERVGLLELPRAPLDGLDEWIDPLRRTRTIKII